MKKALSAIIIWVFLVDRAAKLLVSHFIRRDISIVPGFLSINYVENRGAAFSAFSNLNGAGWDILLILFPLAVVLIMVYMMFSEKVGGITSYGFAFVVGGAAGNLLDRFVYGKVIDFIDLHAGSYHWPSFNFADLSIFIGCLIIVFKR